VIVNRGYNILKVSYNTLTTLNKEASDIYFKGLTPSSTRRRPAFVLKGLKRGYNVINNPDHDQIDGFREAYETSIEELDTFIERVVDVSFAAW